MAGLLFGLIIGFIVFEFGLSKGLSLLNLSTWDRPLPEIVKDLYDANKYKEARDYARANFSVGLVSSILMLIITLLFLYANGFAWVDEKARSYSDSPILQSLIFFGIIGLASFIISLPFDVYSTFVVEEKFGFNKTTPLLFVSDKLKAIALSVVLGGGILALLTWLYAMLGSYFWIAAWVVVSSLTIVIAMFYTSWLLPLFNKLTPLEDGDLRRSIEAYAQRVSFPLTNIFIMDGSKRSTKANAFFSGLGSKKNIVLYDNLVNDMSIDEITAVLAHEVGHYKKKHVLQSMVISVAQMGILFFLFGWLSSNPVLAEVLGARENSFHLSLIAFSLLYSPVSLVTGLLMNLFSRKNEYEADAYAKNTYAAEPLITSLKKLSVNHLSNLQPHPAFVFFNYSHPTLLQRMSKLLV
jgi:STE24 endopeptidase